MTKKFPPLSVFILQHNMWFQEKIINLSFSTPLIFRFSACLGIIFCIASSFFPAFPQPVGNEWIDYTQRYFKFKVISDGIYRIDYPTVNSAFSAIGQPIPDPRKMQVFGRGKELYIHIEGETDSIFNSGDFIEFYAEKNDGWLDSLIYVTPGAQPNPYYSLFNDTATYYLTWNSSPLNKRMETTSDFQFPPAPAPWFFKENIVSYPEKFYIPTSSNPDPQYVEGKGWYSSYFDFPCLNVPCSLIKALNTTNIYSGQNAPSAIFKTVLSSISNTGANPDHRLIISYGSAPFTLTDTTFSGYKIARFENTIPSANLGPTQTSFTFTPGALTPQPVTEKFVLSHIYLKYPHTFDMEGQSTYQFTLPPNSFKTYISISNFSTDTVAHIYNLTDNKRIVAMRDGSIIKANVAAGIEKKCYITTANKIATIPLLIPVSANGLFTNYYNPVFSPAFIIITHRSLWESAQEYSTYRSSPSGGSRNVIVADIDDLYDQYAYGVNKHPLAIRNFCRFALFNFPSPPKDLFLLGKAISEASYSTRNNQQLYAQSLVPTFGWPSSDVAFTAGINTTLYEPAIPTGRLVAKNNDEVRGYLAKIKEYEANQVVSALGQTQTEQQRLWMKRLLHLCGGQGAVQGSEFCGYLKGYEATIKGPLFGGKVSLFSKNSTEVIQTNLTDSIRWLIESGVSIMTFFGHSSAGTFDVSVDNPKTYNNKGKYPLVIANGCYSGDVFTPGSQSTSENFVILPDKGAIGFIATTELGYAYALNSYSSALYKAMGKELYGKGIGECMKYAIKQSQGTGTDPNSKGTALTTALHGDPSVAINPHSLPDYAITASSVFFDPQTVTSANDSFQLKIAIANLGRAIDTTLLIELRHRFPTGVDSVYTKIIPAVYYKDTIVFTLPIDKVNGIGLNRFQIYIDPQNSLAELSDFNNDIVFPEKDLWISSDELFPVFPYNYAVVPTKKVTLKASTGNVFAPSRSYLFQIDTSANYNSGELKQTTVQSAGGVVQWDLDTGYLITSDSMVYFWRVAHADSMKWREHSFQYIPGKQGWGQDHFYQFRKNELKGIAQDFTSLKFNFDTMSITIRVEVQGNPVTDAERFATAWYKNFVREEYDIYGACPSIIVGVVDGTILEAWGSKFQYNLEPPLNPDHNFGNENNMNNLNPNKACGSRQRVENYFIFRIDKPEQMDSLAEFLSVTKNKIPDGHYILAYTGIKGRFQDATIWKPKHFNAFKNLGAVNIESVGNDNPYIFCVKKGDPSSAKEVIGNNPRDYLIMNFTAKNNVGTGKIISPLIGPALNWKSLSWSAFPFDMAPTDSITVTVLGKKNQYTATEVPLLQSKTFADSITNLESLIKAKDYPYLRLKAEISDTATKTCLQLDRWHVLYDCAPEAALNPAAGYLLYNSLLQEGDNLRFLIAIQNISDCNMDSLRVNYWIEDQARSVIPVPYPRQAPLMAGKTLLDTLKYNTRGLSGVNFLSVEVNPQDSLWQPEQYHFNNMTRVSFSVQRDVTNPLLDITFDGIRILNGDIVSAKPHIGIRLKDENKYLALDDTSNFTVTLKRPSAKAAERLYFAKYQGTQPDKTRMTWIKAALPNNKFTINYDPEFTEDGKYELRVQAMDASKNNSGNSDYTIEFQVITKPTIGNVLNYPNPFSTSTRFVFELTGSEVPEVFTIQILTVTGKVAREITQDELGMIHVGRNISQFAWDGTDEYGDFLANGIYLYRVISKLHGQDIEHRSTAADQFFSNGFGKMYLMR